MAEYLEHRTSEGERWDTLAFRYYGDADKMEPIVSFNFHVPIGPTLPAGVLIGIPILEDTPAAPDPEDLPPWKR